MCSTSTLLSLNCLLNTEEENVRYYGGKPHLSTLVQQERHTHPGPQPFSSTNPVLCTNYHIISTMVMIGITSLSEGTIQIKARRYWYCA
ncbi:hypothetical protein L873DRAFT_1043904 [Choiromyces venosus 120613-1]|uniref:Uncharacterized protein n=1 Tax=Choiromyces venosus 120613-1 TaxID=1336337 RepID=A0A3N4JM93_9PEZI|nr:hypothetical protein L873DRAFT_1043904 [Choiromyces venosus 120613-1]